MLLSVNILKWLLLEIKIPCPTVGCFDCNDHPRDWIDQENMTMISRSNPQAESQEESIIAFSDGASSFIRPFYAAHPHTSISEMDSDIYAQPLILPNGNFEKFTKLRRLAIPEQLLARNSTATRSFHKFLFKLLKELQLQNSVGAKLQVLDHWGQDLRTARMHALANDKEACLPQLRLVIC